MGFHQCPKHGNEPCINTDANMLAHACLVRGADSYMGIWKEELNEKKK